MTCKEIRREASLKCEKNSGRLALMYFIFTLIVGASSINISVDENLPKEILLIVSIIALLFSLVALAISIFVSGPMNYGMYKVIISNYNGFMPDTRDLFSGFRRYWHTVGLYWLIMLYTLLWSFLFIIPGIIKGISYSMAYFISVDNPRLSPNECITESKKMMKGHKWDLFVLQLSYFGWYLLIILTLGILSFWVIPKQMTAVYIFYRKIVKKPEEQIEEENSETVSE